MRNSMMAVPLTSLMPHSHFAEDWKVALGGRIFVSMDKLRLDHPLKIAK